MYVVSCCKSISTAGAATVKWVIIWFAGLPTWSGFRLVRLGDGLNQFLLEASLLVLAGSSMSPNLTRCINLQFGSCHDMN